MATLDSLLAESQRIGLIGPGNLETATAQARLFVEALPLGPLRVVDVGSGGGLPGLVVLAERPDAHVTLVDRRERSCDVLRRAVRALGATDRGTVVHADLETLGHDPAWRGQFDAATARGVAPPPEVAELVLPLVRPGGVLVVSVAGTGEAWPETGLAKLDARIRQRTEGLIVIEAGNCPETYPRGRRSPHLFAG